MKIDKTRPDIIKLHERAPALAVRIRAYDHEMKLLKKEMEAIEHKIEAQAALKKVIFDDIDKVCGEDLKVIAPEGDVKYEIDREEVYLLKGDILQEILDGPCPGCGKVHKLPPGAPPALKHLLDMLKNGDAKIAGVSVGRMDDMPDDLKDFFRRKGMK